MPLPRMEEGREGQRGMEGEAEVGQGGRRIDERVAGNILR